MLVQMLIAEMRDRYALADCAEAYVQNVVPLLTKAQGLQAAHLAAEEGESLLAIVTLMWTSREAAMAWLNGGGHRALGAIRPYSKGDVITKFLRVEHERGNVERHILN